MLCAKQYGGSFSAPLGGKYLPQPQRQKELQVRDIGRKHLRPGTQAAAHAAGAEIVIIKRLFHTGLLRLKKGLALRRTRHILRELPGEIFFQPLCAQVIKGQRILRPCIPQGPPFIRTPLQHAFQRGQHIHCGDEICSVLLIAGPPYPPLLIINKLAFIRIALLVKGKGPGQLFAGERALPPLRILFLQSCIFRPAVKESRRAQRNIHDAQKKEHGGRQCQKHLGGALPPKLFYAPGSVARFTRLEK